MNEMTISTKITQNKIEKTQYLTNQSIEWRKNTLKLNYMRLRKSRRHTNSTHIPTKKDIFTLSFLLTTPDHTMNMLSVTTK